MNYKVQIFMKCIGVLDVTYYLKTKKSSWGNCDI
jgi:hypothetical protein